MSISLDPDQARHFVCKSYQQITLAQGAMIFSYIHRLEPFLGVQNIEFQYLFFLLFFFFGGGGG